MAACMKINKGSNFGCSYRKDTQALSEPHVDFIGRSKAAIEKQVKGEQNQEL